MHKPARQIFKDKADLFDQGRCTQCMQVITSNDILVMDKLSRREYQISGMCQSCQDKLWGADYGTSNDILVMDKLSRREYQISGMCQSCQDKLWGADYGR
jgi:hypothetical protein